ncbi:MAG: hypothetical protein M1540_04135 [Candidatus Bathyarchaeota archaeon]|nr:hypothetical protein [Candidatus Bathyarchaeota archaeon]
MEKATKIIAKKISQSSKTPLFRNYRKISHEVTTMKNKQQKNQKSKQNVLSFFELGATSALSPTEFTRQRTGFLYASARLSKIIKTIKEAKTW